jgi:hypothetical protein
MAWTSTSSKWTTALASSFTCPRCGAISHNKHDAEEGYCGACHDWTGSGSKDPIRLRQIARAELGGDPHRLGLSDHARTCSEPWCIEYLKIYEEVKRAT